MNKKEMIDEIVNLADYQQQVKNQARTFCQDLSIPIEDRWEVFTYYDGQDESQGAASPLDSIPEDILNCWDSAPFYYNKYETCDLTDIYERIFDPNIYEKEEMKVLIVKHNLDKDMIREEIMQKFIRKHEFYW